MFVPHISYVLPIGHGLSSHDKKKWNAHAAGASSSGGGGGGGGSSASAAGGGGGTATAPGGGSPVGGGGTPGETTPTVETTAFLKDKWPRYSNQEVLCDIHEINYVLKDWAVLLDGRFITTEEN